MLIFSCCEAQIILNEQKNMDTVKDGSKNMLMILAGHAMY